MSLYQQLQQRAADNKPIRVALIGAGKFGAMYLAQVPRTPGVHLLGIDSAYYLVNMTRYTDPPDVLTGLIKSVVFGAIIAVVSCYKGLTCQGGAEGVGKATTEAVVAASISILITNFFLTLFLSRVFYP